MAQRNVVLVTEEPVTASAVATALQEHGSLGSEDVCRDLADLGTRLDRAPVPAVLVDIDSHPTQMLSGVEELIRRFPDTRFIVLASAMQSDLVLEAMQTGARHFMIKNQIPNTLLGVLHRLVGNGYLGNQRLGTALTILSASGGCGATTLAVNLAYELQLASSELTLLVDLDHSYGSVGAYLGVDGQHGVVDLLGRPQSSIDPELITTTALTYSDRLKVLISTSSTMLGEQALPGYDRVRGIIDACRHSYRMTVIDAPRMTLDVAAELAKSSAATFLVFQLGVKDIRLARSMVNALTMRGVAPESIHPLVNRYHRRSLMISLAEAQRALEGYKITCLANDFQSASRSANFGQPLAKSTPRSALRKELQQLAESVLNGTLMRTPARQ